MNEQEDYRAAYEGNIGADRMRLGLAIIPDRLRGDMDEVIRLRRCLEYIACSVFCISLERATEVSKQALQFTQFTPPQTSPESPSCTASSPPLPPCA